MGGARNPYGRRNQTLPQPFLSSHKRRNRRSRSANIGFTNTKQRIERRATQKKFTTGFQWRQTRVNGSMTEKQNALSEKYTIVDANPLAGWKAMRIPLYSRRSAVSPMPARRLLIREGADGSLAEVTPDSYYVDQYWWSEDGVTLYFTERPGLGRAPAIACSVGNRCAPTSGFQRQPRRILSLRFHRISRGDISPACGRTTILRRKSRFLTRLLKKSRRSSI